MCRVSTARSVRKWDLIFSQRLSLFGQTFFGRKVLREERRGTIEVFVWTMNELKLGSTKLFDQIIECADSDSIAFDAIEFSFVVVGNDTLPRLMGAQRQCSGLTGVGACRRRMSMSWKIGVFQRFHLQIGFHSKFIRRPIECDRSLLIVKELMPSS